MTKRQPAGSDVSLKRQLKIAVKALAFYADPTSYFACSFLFDPPTGGFDEDFEPFDEWFEPCDLEHPGRRDRPGKTAREALNTISAIRRGRR